MKQTQQIFLFLVFITSILSSCLPSPYYQKNTPLPRNEWDYGFVPSYRFEIDDTTALYDPYFIIRHTEVYPFSNIWLNIYTKAPGDTAFSKSRIEIPLAEPSGKWLGRGMGDIYEQRMSITRPVASDNMVKHFSKRGTYEIKLEQNMRTNPLPDILHVGLRVEKAGQTRRY